MNSGSSRAVRLVLACVMTVLACACRGREESPSSGPALLPVSLPPLLGADKEAQQQMRDAYNAMTAKVAIPDAAPADRGTAYGEMGKLFMAAELNDAAEPCFLNALTIVPDDPRWTYYLAHLYKRKGDLAKSAEYFERTVALRPANVAALWWLGTVYLAQGRPDDAEVRFSRALALQPGALSAVYGLGRAALARNDYARAVEYLERVLAMNERAVAAHYPLGLAYRGMGQLQQAQAHLGRRSHMEILPIDPLMNELEGELLSTTAFLDRGMKASQAGEWKEAVAQFRRAVESSPDDPTARLNLSSALVQTGDVQGAREQAREALRLAPENPRARYLTKALSAPGQ